MDSARRPWEERETEGSSLDGRTHRDAAEVAKLGEIGVSFSRASSTLQEWPHAGSEKGVERDSRTSKDSRSDHPRLEADVRELIWDQKVGVQIA